MKNNLETNKRKYASPLISFQNIIIEGHICAASDVTFTGTSDSLSPEIEDYEYEESNQDHFDLDF